MSLSFSLTDAQAEAYVRRHLPSRPCCAAPQRRLVYCNPVHWPLAHHAFPALDCVNCETLSGTGGWRDWVWQHLVQVVAPFSGFLHLAQPVIWIDPPLQERAS